MGRVGVIEVEDGMVYRLGKKEGAGILCLTEVVHGCMDNFEMRKG